MPQQWRSLGCRQATRLIKHQGKLCNNAARAGGGTRTEAAQRALRRGFGECFPMVGPELCKSPLLLYYPRRTWFHLMMEPVPDTYGICRILTVGRGIFHRVLGTRVDEPERCLPPDFWWVFTLQ